MASTALPLHCLERCLRLDMVKQHASSFTEPLQTSGCNFGRMKIRRIKPSSIHGVNRVHKKEAFLAEVLFPVCALPTVSSASPSTDAVDGLLPLFPHWRRVDVVQCLLMVALSVLLCAFGDPSMAAMPLQHKCDDVVHYYQGLDDLKGAKLRKKLFNIIKNHHVVSYDQVWDALKILDAADPFNPEASIDIIEIYSQKAVLKALAGKADGWNREHLWPRSYGIRRGQAEFSDLHNLRPSDANVNFARGRKYYGECMRNTDKSCLVPANREAALDTATNKKIWMPPFKVRGDIARSLMYMAVRYGTSEADGGHFQLSDSPNAELHRMGLLSVLLHWNATDLPSSEEKIRNWRVCTMYQHNRNPFVDYPEFADLIWRVSNFK